MKMRILQSRILFCVIGNFDEFPITQKPSRLVTVHTAARDMLLWLSRLQFPPTYAKMRNQRKACTIEKRGTS